jgi:hypothetical protein
MRSRLGHEIISEASDIRQNASLIPGIFQTPDYARAIIAATGPWLDTAETERRAAARSARQQALFGAAQIPRIHVVLDESALRRQVGGPEVTRQQMSALADAAHRPEVTFQVLPFTAGASAGIDGDFVIFTFPDPEDPPVVYLEGLFGDLYLESEEETTGTPWPGRAPDRSGAEPSRIRRHARRPRGGHPLTTHDTTDAPAISWRKSSRSNAGNNCVEIARTPAGITIRDSTNPHHPHLTLTTKTFTGRCVPGTAVLLALVG